jgi:WD40 repeat protein
MKKVLITAFAYLSIFSCSSSDDDITDVVITQPVIENKINLTSNFNSTTETVNLNWTLAGDLNYMYYKILRSDSPNGQQTELGTYNPTQFSTVQSLPFSPYLEYQIIGIKANGEQVKSNIAKIERPEIKLLNLKVFDAQFDKNTGKLYLLDTDGKIAIYDVNSGAVTHQISTNAVLGYADLGVYGGTTELYVSRKDGWVDIYDGNTLALKDQINFGMQLVSTVYHNGKVYGSSSGSEDIKCMDRGTKTLVSQSTSYYSGRMRKSVGTSVKLYTITQNITPVDMDLYNFDLNGNYINHQDDIYHGDHSLNYRIFETFPDGRIITSSSGAVYNSQMIYQNDLPSGNSQLTSFDFDSNSIIAGNMAKTIDFYNINTYSKTQTINTKRFPYKVFSYNNKVICLSSISQLNVQDYDYSNVIPENVMIEVFNK